MLSWIWLWQTEQLTEIGFGMALLWYGQLLAALMLIYAAMLSVFCGLRRLVRRWRYRDQVLKRVLRTEADSE